MTESRDDKIIAYDDSSENDENNDKAIVDLNHHGIFKL